VKYSHRKLSVMWSSTSKFSENGFSLVQVMVSVGIMGGLALMMMTMMENQTKQQKTIELNSEKNDIKAIIKQVISNLGACNATFIGMSPGDEIREIRTTSDMSVAPFAQTGVKFKNMNVYIKSMRLLTRQEELDAKLREVGSDPIQYNYDGFGFGYLRITFVKNIGAVTDANKSHQFYGARETSVDIPISGNFYHLEMVKHTDQLELEKQCYEQAKQKGTICTVGASDNRCYFKIFGEIKDIGSEQPIYLGECRYFRDDSPFISCTTPK
jgi:hypothetical protein